MTRPSEDQTVALLRSYREARFNAERCARKVAEAKSACESLTARLTSSPHSSGTVHRDGPWAALADASSAYETAEQAALRQMRVVESFIALVPGDTYRMILRLRYVDLLKWPEIQKQLQRTNLYYDVRQIFRLHRQALDAARNCPECQAKLNEEDGSVDNVDR